jgi:hypothetical protein
METVVDPEFDPRPPQRHGVCAIGKCDGSGFVRVSDAYVDRWAGAPPSIPEGETPLERALFEESHRLYRAVRAAFSKSSYPCPSCMPVQFERWSGGHWESGHDREACADCRRVDAASGKHAHGRRRRQPAREKERESLPPESQAEPEPEPPEQMRADLR